MPFLFLLSGSSGTGLSLMRAQQGQGDRLLTPTCGCIRTPHPSSLALPAWRTILCWFWYSDLPWQADAVGCCLIPFVPVWPGNSSAGKGVGGQGAEHSSAADAGTEGGSSTPAAWTRARRRLLYPPSPQAFLRLCWESQDWFGPLLGKGKVLWFATMVKVKLNHRIIIHDHSSCCFPFAKKSHVKQLNY